ncbi:uncharacterized protein LOC129718958 [Wyeomyia smithii]|uniref:uncharacterized protein LOC129718958 n=1 Tax=Wyeomyia smithii TaxID=174621 RepID=UPI00246818C2|nr:uncharacterized protein LOC129718958 [Wyeomyia smithii]
MVINAIRSTPAGTTVANSSGGVGSIDRQHSFFRTYPYPFFMYSPGFNPYGNPSGPALVGSPYADMSQQYSLKYGGGDGTGYGSSYGPPGPSHPSGGAVYEYHAPPAAPAHISHPHPVPFHFPASKMKKGKGAALSALTLLAFLYFLNMLQGCLKEHMDAMNPTVMVMTAGATRRKDNDKVTLIESDEMAGEYDTPDEKYRLVTKSPSTFANDKPVRIYKSDADAVLRFRNNNYYDD